MSEYTTEKLIGTLECTVDNYHAGLYPDMKYIDEGTINAIIAKLRAADKLCEAAKKAKTVLEKMGLTDTATELDKARADYEGKG
jgi:hypothetical protein